MKRILKVLLTAIGVVVATAFIVVLVSFFLERRNKIRFQTNLDLGSSYLLESDYEQALISYMASLDIDPNSKEAQDKLEQTIVEYYEDVLNGNITDEGLMEDMDRLIEEAYEYLDEDVELIVNTGLSASSHVVSASDNVVYIPDIILEYYDIRRGTTDTKILSQRDEEFISSNGTELDVVDGSATIPSAGETEKEYIIVRYKADNDKIYNTIIRVLIPRSVLEGNVSAYNTDGTSFALGGANVELYSDLGLVRTIRTDYEGKFRFNISEGDYTLVISSDGYQTLTSNQSVGEDEIKYTEHILLIDDSQSGLGNASGMIANALDGRPLTNVTVRLRSDWNNTSGDYLDYQGFTDSTGRYYINNVPVGYYTVEASMNGYVTGYNNVIVLSDTPRSDFDFTITPVLNEGEIRIVLTWGASPRDLDSHLVGRTPSGSAFNVYYASKFYTYNGREMANLDVDDTSSYGPETITILEDIYGTYTYAVHDYTNGFSSSSNALSLSGAVVRVFSGSVQVAQYNVPTNQVGVYWTVFEISENGNIRPINTISNTKPTA